MIDPSGLLRELDELDARGLLSEDRLLVSDRAHVVLPHHKQIDALREGGKSAIGTTRRGIGPAYEDKVGRRGVRIGDLLDRELLTARLSTNIESWAPVIESLGGQIPDLSSLADELAEHGARLGRYVHDTGAWLARAARAGKRILLEGAQGAMLDIDHGTYPFVTSSSVTAGGAATGSGLGPTSIDRVVGITKAYATRVGSGPFPTELTDDLGDRLRSAGNEYGATTGRPRRCGHLDIVALRHAVTVNGITDLALTKLDVLSGMSTLHICVAYELDGQRLETIPFAGLERVKPVYESLPGFDGELSSIRRRADLPRPALAYIARVEELLGVPIELVSLGPARDEGIGLSDPFLA